MAHNDLPPKLRSPIRIDRLIAAARKNRQTGSGLQQPGEILRAELKERVLLLAGYLGIGKPESEDDWRKFVIAICSRWEVPGFRLAETGRGAKAKWSPWKNIRLLYDVHSLVRKHELTKNNMLSELAACKIIAKNPKKYGDQYPKNEATLYRQFQRAKQETDHFDEGEIVSLLLPSENVDDLLKTERYILEDFISQHSDIAKMGRKRSD